MIWFVFGAAVVYGSWMMDRLESLKIPPATAPGVPTGLLGLCFIAFAFVLLLRRKAAVPSMQDAAAPVVAVDPATDDASFEWRRLALSWVLCITYAGVLLGRGAPYWLLTMVFLFLHLTLLDEGERVPARPSRERLILAAILAPAFAIAVANVFQRLFYVRLP